MGRPRTGPHALRLAVLSIVVAAAAASPASRARASDDAAVEAHVTARGDVGPELLAQFVRLGEACYPQWKAYFGAEPPKDRLPLRMDVRKDRDGFLRALAAAGVQGAAALSGAGGYYDPGSRTSFLYLQPHLSSTRLLVLHELTHQYQYKAVLGDRSDRSPTWHKEGLAEHFGCHRRTETGLETGALDVVSIDDRPVQCAARVAAGTYDPWAVGTGKLATPDYVDALAMVETFLRTKDAGLKAAYRAWEKDLDRGGDPFAKFERDFAGKKGRLEAAVKEVWGGFRRTWKVVYIAWDEEPGTVVGRGLPWAFLEGQAPLKAEADAVEAEVLVEGTKGGGGVALGVHGPDDLVAAELWADGRVTLRRKQRGVWYVLGVYALPGGLPGGPAREPVRLRLVARGVQLQVEVGAFPAITVDGMALGLNLADLAGAAGLIAQEATVRFSRLRMGTPPP